jgi:hypothetical protein
MSLDDLRAFLAQYPSNIEVLIETDDGFEPITGVTIIQGPGPLGIKQLVLTSLHEEAPPSAK